MDLRNTSTPNNFDIHFYLHGDKESFEADSLTESSDVEHRRRYLVVRVVKPDEKGQEMGNRIKTQCLFIRFATGETSRGIDEESQ
jgi:hypothetical protein